MIEQVRDCIAGALGTGGEQLRLAPDAALVESGIVSSVDMVAVAAALEERFGIEIPATAVTVGNFNTLESLARMVEGLRAGSAAALPARHANDSWLQRGLAACLRRPFAFGALIVATFAGLDVGLRLLLQGPLAARYHAFLESGARLYPVSGGYGVDDLSFLVAQHRVAAPQAAGGPRVAVFGDSGTIGSWVRPEEAVPGALEIELRRRHPGAVVYNLAHYMQSLTKDVTILEAVLRNRGVAPFEVVVLTVGDMYFNRAFGAQLLRDVPFLSLNKDLFREFTQRLSPESAGDAASLHGDIVRADSAHRMPLMSWLERNAALFHYAPYFRYVTRPRAVFDSQYEIGRRSLHPDPGRPPPAGEPLSSAIPDPEFDPRVVTLLDATVGLLRDGGARVILFLKPEGPREWRGLYRRTGTRDARDIAATVCRQDRCSIVDERWALSGAQFTDSLAHYTPDANRLLGRSLAGAVHAALEAPQ